MSFFLSTRGFCQYVDHHWSTGGSKDITGHLISQHRMFLLVFFFHLKNTRTKRTSRSSRRRPLTPSLTKNLSQYLEPRGVVGDGLSPPIKMPSPLRQVAWECGDCATTNQGREQLPARTAAQRILAGTRFWRGVLLPPLPGRLM